jgi:hypothetical protein
MALPGDAAEMIALLRKQYGAAYQLKMYDEEFVRKLIENNILSVVVAEASLGIVGMMGSNTENDFPGALAFTMLVIKPEMRGFGLSKILQGFLIETVPSGAFTCIYAHCLAMDIISQLNHITFGYRMTGLLLNSYRYDSQAEYLAGLSIPLKNAFLVACLPQAKQDAGLLYAPPSYAAYIDDVYTSLGVGYTLSEGREPTILQSICSIHQDEYHRYCELFIQEAAPDFVGILDGILRQYAGLEHQTFNIFVNLNDPACSYACRHLEEKGFFFTGLQPLSGEYEYMILHYSPSIPVLFDQVAIIPELKRKLSWVQKRYQEMQNVKKN